jgi:hypothetical protein
VKLAQRLLVTKESCLEDIETSLSSSEVNLLDRLFLLDEKLTVRGTIKLYGVIWIFGRSRFPTAALGKDKIKDEYSLLTFKANKNIHPSLLPDSVKVFDNPTELIGALAKVASKGNIFKNLFDKQKPSMYLELLINKQGINPAHINSWFPGLSEITQENSLMAGKFEIIYQTEKEGKDIGSLFTDACKIIGSAGFDKICYGKVYSTPSLKSNVLADYTENTDTVRISNKAKKSSSATRIVIHELGHRLSRLFFKDKHWEEVKKRYYEILKVKIEIKTGDRFIDNDGSEIEVTGSEYKRKLKYKFKKVMGDGKLSPVGWTAEEGYFLKLDKVGDKKKGGNPFLVSDYARTSPSEFFSEVFSFALVDKDKALLDWIKQFK